MKKITRYFEAADQAHAVKSVALRRELQDAILSASQNASDNVSEDHDEDEWESIFIATLVVITTYKETSKAARAWFALRGIAG